MCCACFWVWVWRCHTTPCLSQGLVFTTKFAGPAGCSFWAVSCLWLLSCCSNSGITEAHYYVWLSMGSGNQNSNSHVHMASTFPTEPSMSTLESNLGLRIRVGLHVGQQALCHWTISQSLQLELKKNICPLLLPFLFHVRNGIPGLLYAKQAPRCWATLSPVVNFKCSTCLSLCTFTRSS